jgi:threonine-phosphate decarboxylase
MFVPTSTWQSYIKFYNLMINGHGDDLYLYGDSIRYNFSSNIYDKVDHTALIAYLCGELGGIAHYPEPEPYSVERKLAAAEGVNADCVLVTNGATEAIYLTAQAYRDATSAILIPTFSEYRDACLANGHKVLTASDLGSMPFESCRLVWICNPNNPTGRAVMKADFLSLIRHNSRTLFVIDQAYEDYTRCDLLTDAEAVDCGNVILLHSMTKRFSVPGLRLGYAVGAPELIAKLRALRQPWSVNHVAIKAADYLLDHVADYVVPVEQLLSEAERVAREFTAMGITVEQSATNFMLCRLPKATAADLKDYLAKQHGILIRDAANFEGLTPQYFRVAVQSEDENDILLNAVKQWITL